MSDLFKDKRILITGGTGSLGKILTRRILTGQYGKPARITIFSRDEAKQHEMRLAFHHMATATEEIIYYDAMQLLHFHIGDVRDFHSISSALINTDVVFNTAALKQVPACEYFPNQAVATNVSGPDNIVKAIETLGLKVDTVIGVSTDKACKPVNVMGMTKAIQERVFITANLRCPNTRFICVRYGNVLASRGSVVPLFHYQIRFGGPVTITTPEMTRFLLSLEQAIDTIIDAYSDANRGEIFIPRIPASLIINIAKALIGNRDIETKIIGIRPGEKVHEILVAEDEAYRTITRGNYYVIKSILPELNLNPSEPSSIQGEYSSKTSVMDFAQTRQLLETSKLMIEDVSNFEELLR